MSAGPIFLLLLVTEVVALVVCLKTIGFLATLGLAFLSILIGVFLLRWQGLLTLERFVNKLEFGEPPMQEGWDGFCIMAAGFLFILPGLVSDVAALLLLLPPARRLLWALLQKSGQMEGHYWFDSRAIKRSRAGSAGKVVEAEWREVGSEHEQAGPRP